jgi:hypothetical protein
MDEIDPGQPFLRVNILRWREIFRVIETPSSNVDLIGALVVLIGQRRSTATTKRPPRSRLRSVSPWRSFHELEMRTFYYDPGYCLGSGGSPAVSTMTIHLDTDLWRRAETHLAAITATGNFILLHASHRKLGMSDRNRDKSFWWANLATVCRKSSPVISRNAVGAWVMSQPLILRDEQSGLLTHIVTTENASLCERMKS